MKKTVSREGRTMMKGSMPEEEGAGQTAAEEIRALVAELREMMRPPQAKVIGAAWSEKPGDIIDNLKQVKEEMAAGAALTLPRNSEYSFAMPSFVTRETVAERLDRLLFLLGLSAGERAFVTACAEEPQDEVNLLVFADWLEDRGRPEEAARIRRFRPEQGDVILLTFPQEGGEQAREALVRAARGMRADLKAMGKEVYIAVMPDDHDLSLIDARMMAEATKQAITKLRAENEGLRAKVKRLEKGAMPPDFY